MSIESTAGGRVEPAPAPGDPPSRRADQIEDARRQRSWRIKVALVWVGILIFLAIGFHLVKFDTTWMRHNWKFIYTGIWVTIVIAIISMICALILALLGALGRLSSNPIAYGISGFYTSFFRGTPLIVQLFLIYFGLAQIAVNVVPTDFRRFFIVSGVVAGIIALSFNYGAYITEIFRAGIQAIGHGQSEAAEALGMNYRQRMRRIVLPQAARIVIPPIGNEFIAMIKDTALVGFVATTIFWSEIFKRAQTIGNEDFKPMEAFILAAIVYWGLTIVFSFFQARLERRMSAGYVRGTTGGQMMGMKGH